ncbi:MAG: hypothetical protein IT378_08470 [Sandaracinaceae bacterium]|nr:hypothetical protein [Sandaracinaceae bacterium]
MAQRKLRETERAARRRDEGVIVVTDRFPHPQERLLDGPGIVASPADPWWRRAAAVLEKRAFARSARVGPDLVIRLNVSAEVAHARKPDHRLTDIVHKAEALRRTQYASPHVVDLDADEPLELVLARIKRAVWSAL